MTYDLALSLARIAKAVFTQLLGTGPIAGVAQDWRVMVWGAIGAAIGAVMVDIDAFIRARESRRLAQADKDRAVEHVARQLEAQRKEEETK